jgi:putative hydrolases of HD superfamily
MDTERFKKQLDFIVEVDKAKNILRNTILMDSSRRENDAEHSWHMAISALILQEYLDDSDVDLCKVLKMALIHDVVDVDAGDVFAYGNVDWNEKKEKEEKAAERIFGILPEDQKEEFLKIWNEYEEAQTAEAKFAQMLDSFMPIFHNYKTNGLQWQRLDVTREKVLARNRRIEKGSKKLWNYIVNIVNEAVEKGYLKP